MRVRVEMEEKDESESRNGEKEEKVGLFRCTEVSDEWKIYR